MVRRIAGPFPLEGGGDSETSIPGFSEQFIDIALPRMIIAERRLSRDAQ
jgi:hypothetical protein